MNDYDDLDWLAEGQPLPLEPDEAATARARTALMEHIVPRSVPVAARPVRRPVRRAERRWLRPSRVLARAAVGAAAAVTFVAVGSGGDGHGPLGVGVEPAVAAPLVKLSAEVGQMPALPGDATLIERHHTFADGKTMDGADLYLDNGDYYYAETRQGLPRAIRAHERLDSGFATRSVAVAVAVADGSLDLATARVRMANAPLDPNAKPADPAAVPSDVAAKVAAEIKRKNAAAASLKPMDPERHIDGMAWSSSFDAIMAGGSRPDVRAGVLALLATIPNVVVSETALEGRPALLLRSKVFDDNYEEQLWIDAKSGIPLRFVGTYPNQTPGVVMTYKVARVTVAKLAKK
jgi:hypothetical protein